MTSASCRQSSCTLKMQEVRSVRASAAPAAAAPGETPAAGGALARTLRTSCIFKVHDDCRQDALVMQAAALLKRSWDGAALGTLLFPYRILPTRTGAARSPGGILEMVPDVRSRDELGKSGFASLYDYFVASFGRPDGAEFEAARRTMARSLAASSVLCFLMWIKDRHNGNLLITSAGAVIHIDFGFILGISPGGNLGFETAAFKLTQEYVNIMGGALDGEHFANFAELVVRAYLVARAHAGDALVAAVAGFADSGLPCFAFPDALAKLAGRLRNDEGDVRAARFMRAETLAAANRLTTVLYDGIQALQNGIASEAFG